MDTKCARPFSPLQVWMFANQVRIATHLDGARSQWATARSVAAWAAGRAPPEKGAPPLPRGGRPSRSSSVVTHGVHGRHDDQH